MTEITGIAKSLTRNPDGIWRSNRVDANVSYPDDGHSNCFQVEDNSFWFQHRNACINSLVRCYPPLHDGPVLDIGGGNGFVSKALQEMGINTILVEPGSAGAKNAHQRGVENVVCASFEDAGFMDASISGIGMFDVLEHIEDDLGFLTTLKPCLAKGGKLYLTVPAYEFLRSYTDDNAGHYRRYTKSTIKKVLQEAGYSVDYASYIFSLLPLPIFMFRTVPYRLGLVKKETGEQKSRRIEKHHGARKGMVRRIAERLFARETKMIASGKSQGFGGSLLIAASVITKD